MPSRDPMTAEGHNILERVTVLMRQAVNPVTDMPSVRSTQALCPVGNCKQAADRASSRSRPGT